MSFNSKEGATVSSKKGLSYIINVKNNNKRFNVDFGSLELSRFITPLKCSFYDFQFTEALVWPFPQ